MNNKKIIQILVIVVVAVWIFCGVLLVGAQKVKKDNAKQESIQLQTSAINTTAAQTLAPATTTAATEPAVTVSVAGNNVTSGVTVGDPDWKKDEDASIAASVSASQAAEKTTKATTAPTTKSIVPSSKSQIISAYVDGVNKLKSTANFTMSKNDKLNISIDSMTGGSMIQSFADNLIADNQPAPQNYTFSSGSAPSSDGQSTVTPNQVITPFNQSAALSESAIKSATATANSDGGFTVKLALIDEKQTMTSPAQNHSTSMEVINTQSLGLPSTLNITQLDITYSGSTIEATFDKNNRITSMHHYLAVSTASGSGKMALITANVTLHGDYTSDYSITY